MENLKNLLNELRVRKVKQSKRGAYKVIKQTDARKIKQEFMNALLNDLKELLTDGEFIGVDANGIVMEIENESVDAFTIEMNPKVKNLDFDAYESVQAYELDQELKAERKEQRKRDKAAEYKYAQEKRARAKAREKAKNE